MPIFKLAFMATLFAAALLMTSATFAQDGPPPLGTGFGNICPHSSIIKPPPYYEHICSIKPQGICTRDINKCGNPSRCQCPLGYVYNSTTGTCDWSFKYYSHGLSDEAKAPPTRPDDPSGESLTFPPPCVDYPCVTKPLKCTDDINECGNPSYCACPKGYFYNPATGLCNLTL